MAQQIASLYANPSLESASIVSGLRDATKATDRASAAIEKGLDHASTAVKGFVAVFAATKAIDAAQEYLRIADASKQMEAQIKLATGQLSNFGVAQKQVH